MSLIKPLLYLLSAATIKHTHKIIDYITLTNLSPLPPFWSHLYLYFFPLSLWLFLALALFPFFSITGPSSFFLNGWFLLKPQVSGQCVLLRKALYNHSIQSRLATFHPITVYLVMSWVMTPHPTLKLWSSPNSYNLWSWPIWKKVLCSCN